MDQLFSSLKIKDVHKNIYRNIITLRTSEDLYDDLSIDPKDWLTAQETESSIKPYFYKSKLPIIDRPFEDSNYWSAIEYPFRNWMRSRYSDGSFGIWYGGEDIETTAHETVFHWYGGLLSDAGFTDVGTLVHRKIYSVRCDAALLNFSTKFKDYPRLIDKESYTYTQDIGLRLKREGHPGLVTKSARCNGMTYVVLNPQVLSQPQSYCYLTYIVQPNHVSVQRTPGIEMMRISV